MTVFAELVPAIKLSLPARAAQSAPFREYMSSVGATAVGSTPAEFASYLKSERSKWKKSDLHRLAIQVAAQLMAHDALGAHARDELGISETLSARPIQAALVSALILRMIAGGVLAGTNSACQAVTS